MPCQHNALGWLIRGGKWLGACAMAHGQVRLAPDRCTPTHERCRSRCPLPLRYGVVLLTTGHRHFKH